MEGIAGISQRIAAIQSTLGALTPPRTVGAPVGATGGASFASALASEVAHGSRTTSSTPSGGPTTGVPTTTIPTTTVGTPDSTLPTVPGFTAEQVRNAAAVVEAGRARGLSLRDQAIGVMTATGESSLRVLDHGDTAGPDSRGLFQQRDNGAWGTLAQRMDPTASATSFFRALERVGGRDSMAPTLVAHAVQRNADPQHYTRYWDGAVTLVARLTGASVQQITGR